MNSDPRLLHESAPTARKTHHCSLCTGAIHPGQTYSRDTLVYDGFVYDWLTCPACSADGILTMAFDWSYRDEGIDAEVTHEWATETVIHGTPDEQRAAKNFLERAARS